MDCIIYNPAMALNDHFISSHPLTSLFHHDGLHHPKIMYPLHKKWQNDILQNGNTLPPPIKIMWAPYAKVASAML